MDTNKAEEEFIDLAELFGALLHRLWLIVLAAVLCGAAAFSYAAFLITPMYNASAMMIVNAGDRGYDYVSTDQLRSAVSLLDTYSIIISSDTVMDQVKANLGMTQNFGSQVSKVAISDVNGTQVMKITVTAVSPQIALDVCEEITKVAPPVLVDVVEAGSVKLVAKATTSGNKVSPSVKRYTALGALGGMLLTAGIIALITILDNKVKSENDVKRVGLPLLGVIPSYDLEAK